MNDVDMKYLKSLGACPDAVKWVETQPSLREAWRVCKRGDWMLWLAGKMNVDRKELVLAACGCARLALKYVPDGETRPLVAIETAEAWATGKRGVTISQVHAAAYAAYAAAAYAAAYAAYAAYAADAAYAAAYAADAAADDNRMRMLSECATAVRRVWPTLPEGASKEPLSTDPSSAPGATP